jgi:hypothetical protein
MKWVGHAELMRERGEVCSGFGWGKRPFRRPRHRCEGNILDIQDVGFVGVDGVNLSQDRDRWRALAFSGMISGFHKMRGIS